MALSDEFLPELSLVESFVAKVLVPELSKLEPELGLAPQVQFHVHFQGKDSESFGGRNAPWIVRLIFRRTYNENRILVQAQARPVQVGITGFSGFRMKGEFSPASLETSFTKRSLVNEYNTNDFKAWS